ncbi:MAG: amidohydrolase family protein, partial [Spirochaetales bacterium]|nr:amidohydrolase family protein [Spirochaetales bacterium]
MKATCEKRLIINATLVSGNRSGLFINEEGRIADVFSMTDFDRSKYGDCSVLDVEGRLVTPGLIDTHIHGIGGYDPADCNSETTLRMSETLARFGVTGFLPTLYAGRPEKMKKEASAIAKAIGNESGARILGINLEGPFLNP